MPTQPVTITYNFSETNYEDIIIEETATVNGTSATATIDQNELSNKIQNTDTRKIQISIENTAATTELQVTISDTNLQEIINKNSYNKRY